MRKTILNISLIFALGVMFASCEKEVIQPNTAVSSENVDDLLKDGEEPSNDGKGDDDGNISDPGSEEGGDSHANTTNRPG